MVSRQRLFPLLTAFLALTLLLVACERPLQPDDGDDVGEEVGEVVDEVVDEVESVATAASDDIEVVVTEAADEVEEVATEVIEEVEEATPEPTESEAGDTPRPEEAEEEATPTVESATAEEEETADGEETDAEATEEDEEAATTEEVEEEVEEAAAEVEAARPTTHVVAPGENLYRIGLQYGLSWVALAEANDLNNPGRIRVGQELTVPSEDASGAEPTPSPLTETTYVVQPGDNLFRIGLAYGISWVQIAEANGLVNPNHVVTGQVLKIPVDTPGPTPQFTHQVKPGETLFEISLQYGVPWPAIAEANDISSPYVIYSGQTLVVPGG
jgi:LysM repeat protein